jgi:nucleoid-associated protein YgaU
MPAQGAAGTSKKNKSSTMGLHRTDWQRAIQAVPFGRTRFGGEFMAQEIERLKEKYQPALNLMGQLQVQVQNINMEGSKLLIRGIAPSPDVKNKIWDQIKLIDNSYSDLICDISVAQQRAPSMTAGASASGGQNQRTYIVKAGDTLSKISQQFYGSPEEYRKIFDANRGVLRDPNTIRPGQELAIPE